MSAALGVGGIALGGALFAVGLVTGITWVIGVGFLTVFGAALLAFNLGPAY